MASNNMSMRIVFDNSPMVIEETKKQVKKGLVSWGTIAEGYAKEDAAVNTGRMRNSITWAIKGQQSPPNTNKTSQGGADAAPVLINRATISASVFIADLLAVPAVILGLVAVQKTCYFNGEFVFLVIPLLHDLASFYYSPMCL